jgi:hypothetical protein
MEEFAFYDSATESGTVSGVVWDDADSDGIRDAGELPIAGATVNIFNTSDRLVGTALTDLAGAYSLSVPTGQAFYLVMTQTGTRTVTLQNAGGNDAVDSDIQRVTGKTALMTFGSAGDTIVVDAGYAPRGGISGAVFNDRNGNGIRDNNEEVATGLVIYSDVNGNNLREVDEPFTTMLLGSYSLGGLLGGANLIRIESREGWTLPPAIPLNVVANTTISSINLAVHHGLPDSAAWQANGQLPTLSDVQQVALSRHGNFSLVNTQRFDQNGNLFGSPINALASAVAVAIEDDGTVVALYQSNGLYLKWFASNGSQIGVNEMVSPAYDGYQEDFNIGLDDAGNVVVVWKGYNEDHGDNGIVARLFNADHSPKAAPFIVNAFIPGRQDNPRLAVNSAGDFVVTWIGDGLSLEAGTPAAFARSFAHDGTSRSTDILIRKPLFSPADEIPLSVGIDASGRFIVAWKQSNAVVIQAFTPEGVALTIPVIRTVSGGIAELPDVAMNDNGSYVLVWQNRTSSSIPATETEIVARRFNSIHATQSEQFQVNTYSPGAQSAPRVVMDADGNFIVRWTSSAGDRLKRFAATPVPIASATQFHWQQAPLRASITFDADLSTLISTSNFILTHVGSGTPVALSNSDLSWNAANEMLTISFASQPNGLLADGEYRLGFLASGTLLATQTFFNFSFLNGDATGDGAVNIADLRSFAANFGQASSFDYTKGDFNYDGFVDRLDLAILSRQWQKTLVEPPPPPAPPAPVATSASSVVRPNVRTASTLVDSIASRR